LALLAAGNTVLAAAMPPRQREAGEQPPTKNGRVREASEVPPRCAANAATSAIKTADGMSGLEHGEPHGLIQEHDSILEQKFKSVKTPDCMSGAVDNCS